MSSIETISSIGSPISTSSFESFSPKSSLSSFGTPMTAEHVAISAQSVGGFAQSPEFFQNTEIIAAPQPEVAEIELVGDGTPTVKEQISLREEVVEELPRIEPTPQPKPVEEKAAWEEWPDLEVQGAKDLSNTIEQEIEPESEMVEPIIFSQPEDESGAIEAEVKEITPEIIDEVTTDLVEQTEIQEIQEIEVIVEQVHIEELKPEEVQLAVTMARLQEAGLSEERVQELLKKSLQEQGIEEEEQKQAIEKAEQVQKLEVLDQELQKRDEEPILQEDKIAAERRRQKAKQAFMEVATENEQKGLKGVDTAEVVAKMGNAEEDPHDISRVLLGPEVKAEMSKIEDGSAIAFRDEVAMHGWVDSDQRFRDIIDQALQHNRPVEIVEQQSAELADPDELAKVLQGATLAAISKSRRRQPVLH